ncbi:MAG: cyclase family protein [Anaerolineales bacterium]
MMRIYDISIPLQPGMPIWPGDPPLRLERLASISDGADANVSSIACGVHIGTHVDAPLHFINDGSTVDQLSLSTLVGDVHVVEIPNADIIDEEILDRASIPSDTKRVLFKTKNSAVWASPKHDFQHDFVAIASGGAAWIVDRGIELVGVDYLSVAPFESPVATHVHLLEHDVIIVEGLDLHKIVPGKYFLVCLPIKLVGIEGSPARAVLLQTEE